MLIVPFCLEITFSGTYGPRQWANVQHLLWNQDGPDRTSGLLGTLALAMQAAWSGGVAHAMNEHVALNNIKVADLDSASALTVDLGTSINGSRSSAGMPGNVAVLATKVDGHSRSQRSGRSFFVGVCEVDTASADPSSLDTTGVATWVSAVGDYFGALSGSLDGNGYYPVVLHKGVGSGDMTPYEQEAFAVQGKLATQRRRLR